MWVGVGLALASAVVHALWNLAVAARPPSVAGAGALEVVGAAALLPTLVLGVRMDAATLGIAVVSAAFETAYFLLLAEAYRRAAASVVYPVARGAAPVITLAITTALGLAHVTVREAVGVAVTCGGIVLVRGLALGDGRRALGLALATAAMISGYTVLDAQAIGRHDAPPGAYLALVLGLGAGYLAVIDRVRGGAGTLRRMGAAVDRTTVLAGVGIAVAYGLVLVAFAHAPAPLVAALRETSVVVATALAATVLREHVPRARLGGAAVVALGVALMVA